MSRLWDSEKHSRVRGSQVRAACLTNLVANSISNFWVRFRPGGGFYIHKNFPMAEIWILTTQISACYRAESYETKRVGIVNIQLLFGGDIEKIAQFQFGKPYSHCNEHHSSRWNVHYVICYHLSDFRVEKTLPYIINNHVTLLWIHDHPQMTTSKQFSKDNTWSYCICFVF